MTKNNTVSVIVPTLNEADNITELVQRIDVNMKKSLIDYELIVIDDHSTDGTMQKIHAMKDSYNVRAVTKRGKPGKAYSLLEGFEEASNPVICMIDADLQYPPESISEMHNLLTTTGADVVISERQSNETSFMRKLSSKTFNFVFARLLFGIGYDTQSGLKLFRKSILKDFKLAPSPWSFDLEFLVRSLEHKHSIVTHPITFMERSAGVTKVKLLSTTFELAKASITLRINTSFQKLRAGVRANSRFVSRTFPVAVATISLLALLAATTPKTQALDVPLPSSQRLALAIPVVNPIGQVLQGPGQSTDPTTITTPVPPTTSTPNISAAQPSRSSMVGSQQQSNPTASSANTQRSPAAADQTNLYSQPASGTKLAVSQSVNQVALQASQTGTLTGATAQQPFSAFASGYPQATVSATTKDIVTKGSLIAVAAGLLLLLAAPLIKSFTRTSKSPSLQKVQR